MIEKRVQGYIRKHHMIETGDRVLIGLSGGADSAALFHILRRSCSKLGFELLAVHVDHGLRGMEARRDRKFVQAVSDSLPVRGDACEGHGRAKTAQPGGGGPGGAPGGISEMEPDLALR